MSVSNATKIIALFLVKARPWRVMQNFWAKKKKSMEDLKSQTKFSASHTWTRILKEFLYTNKIKITYMAQELLLRGVQKIKDNSEYASLYSPTLPSTLTLF